MRTRTAILCFGLALAAGCASGPEPAPVTTTSTPTTAVASPAPSLTPQQLLGLEATPGNTPALAEGVEPAPAPVAGLAGTPGPSPAYGPEDAPVRIYLFTDFQCPVCPRVVEPMKHLLRAYPDDVRLVVKQNALARHTRAARVAAASLAAFRQGKFWEFHDRVFANPAQRSDEDLAAHARALGLDVERFQRDMEDEAVTAQVKYETALAGAIDLAGTPGLVVNGASQPGWASYRGIESLVKRELERARGVAERGVTAGRVAYEATRQSGPRGEMLAAALFAVPR